MKLKKQLKQYERTPTDKRKRGETKNLGRFTTKMN